MAVRVSYFELRTAADLLGKLRHDLARLQRNPTDSYAAFDFFVAANHMPEWLQPGDAFKEARKIERDSSVLLQICDHLSNGVKHVELSYTRHNSVNGTAVRQGAFQPGAFQADAFDVGGLTIQLTGNAAAALGPEIEALDLAKRVLAYWEQRVKAVS